MLQLDNLNAGASSQEYVTSHGNTACTSTSPLSNSIINNNHNHNLSHSHSHSLNHGLNLNLTTGSGSSISSSSNSSSSVHQPLVPFFSGTPGLVPDALPQAPHGFSATMHWGTAVFNPIPGIPAAHTIVGKPLAVAPPSQTAPAPAPPGGEKNDNNPSDEDDDDDYRPFTPPPPRERLSYTRYQLGLLNGIYEEVRYPNSTQKQLIAKRVGITREQVKIWFQNRRRKDVVSKTSTSKTDAEEREVTNSDPKDDDSRSSTDANSIGASSSNEKDINGLTNSRDTPTSATHEEGPAIAGNNDESTRCSNSDDNTTQTISESDKNANETSSATDRSLTPNSLNVNKLVSPLVLKSMIAELNKFDNEYLKLKKNKKKNKSKNARQAVVAAAAVAKSVSPGKAKRLFQNYDMVAPPNKVTPTAFLNTSANRFKHAGGTSAFQNPRENRLTQVPPMPTSDNRLWEGFGLPHNSSLPSPLEAAEILHQHRASLEQSMIPSSYATSFGLQNQAHPSALGGFLSGSTAAAVHHLNTQSPFYENLPVLSELLSSYKNQPNATAAAAASAQRHLEQSLISSQSGAQQQSSGLFSLPNVTSGRAVQSANSACLNNKPSHVDLSYPPSPSHHSFSLNSRHTSYGLNRMFPFPLIAEPPVMLSNVRQTEPIKPQPQWPQSATSITHPGTGQITQGNSAAEESLYRPLAISSLSNPYFSSTPTAYSFPPSLQPPSHLWPNTSPGTDPPDFAQL